MPLGLLDKLRNVGGPRVVKAEDGGIWGGETKNKRGRLA